MNLLSMIGLELDTVVIRKDFIRMTDEWESLGFWARMWRAREFRIRLKNIRMREEISRHFAKFDNFPQKMNRERVR